MALLQQVCISRLYTDYFGFKFTWSGSFSSSGAIGSGNNNKLLGLGTRQVLFTNSERHGTAEIFMQKKINK